MFHYKGFYVWYNSVQHGWIVEVEYAYHPYCAIYKTASAAKSAITQKWSK